MSAFPWPLPILAWGHLFPNCPQTLPQTFSNPPAFAHTMPVPGCSIYLSPSRPLESTRVLMQEFLSFFFSRSFLILLPWGLGRQKCLVPDRCPALWMPKAFGRLCCTVPLNLFVDCPACPRGLLTASDLSLSPNQGSQHHLQPSNPRVAGSQETGLCTSVQTSHKEQPSRALQMEGQDSQQAGTIQLFLLLGASKLIF